MMNSRIEMLTADLRDPSLRERCERLYPLLPPEEQRKAGRFLRDDDRLRFLAGRLLIRTMAEKKCGSTLPEIRLTENGKPYFAGADGLHFNLSHSGMLTVLAVSDAPVGVDVEQIVPLEWRSIAESFGAYEQTMLEQAADPLRCFYRIWTVREAYAKEAGIGLSLYEERTPEISYARGIVRDGGRTRYFSAWEQAGYAFCVCGSAPFQLTRLCRE